MDPVCVHQVPYQMTCEHSTHLTLPALLPGLSFLLLLILPIGRGTGREKNAIFTFKSHLLRDIISCPCSLLLLIDLTGPLSIQFVPLGRLLGLSVFPVLFQLLPLLLRLAPLLLSAFLLFFLNDK